MSFFLAENERQSVLAARERGDLLVNRFWTALGSRVEHRTSSPGLLGQGEDATWWYPAAEYVSDAAMAYALEPSLALGAWLRDTVLGLARRPVADWVGPWYRDHLARPPMGHLETAHLCWAVGTAIDLAATAFTEEELAEVRAALVEKGLLLCRRWLDCNTHLANWRAVLVAGVAVAAAVTGDCESLAYAARETHLCAQAFQPDGSYAESLQYANYLAYALMMAYEAITRAAPSTDAAGPEVYARSMPWIAQSMLYMKPLSGWDAQPRARAVNFNDCGALYRPSGDVVLQVAARCRSTMPTEAGLARWLFDTFYAPVPSQEPHHLASFGLRNDWGFLTLPFLVAAPPALSPGEAGLPSVTGFSNGNMFVRDAWQGRTVLAIQGGTDVLYGPGHLHGDLNSFILTHNNERLLVDPGHSCYRNLIHGLESSTQTHNTCTFLVEQDALGLQEDLAKATLLEQSSVPGRRQIKDGQVGPPVSSRGRRLLLQRLGEVTAAVSEAAAAYGQPIEQFTRIWLQASPHVLLVVDRVRAARPVTAVWNWLLNNRDGASEIAVGQQQREIVLQRGLAGLKMCHFADGRLSGPVYAYVHDLYHPEPNRLGEGRPGSGMLYRWFEPAARQFRVVVHGLAVDDYGLVDGWTASVAGQEYALQRGKVRWVLSITSTNPLQMIFRCEPDQRAWRLDEHAGAFSFAAIAEE